MNADPPKVAPRDAQPATLADIHRLRVDARNMAAGAYHDALADFRERQRRALKATGWALLVCLVAAWVIWSWLSTARTALRNAWGAL